MSDTRDNKFTIKLSDVEKQVVEKLSDAYDCSQSAAARMLFSTHYQELFGEIHPEAFDRHDMDMAEILRGEIDPDEVDDELKMTGESTPQVPAADGGLGASVTPASHTPTQTPTDLEKAGPALSWDELKDAVDSHWGEEFEIHPDRVEPERLKNSHDVCAKIIAAVLRHEQDVIAGPLIEQRIEDYLGHKVTRADYDSGLEYKIDQYKPQIVEHLQDHPNITVETYYATPETVENELPRYVENLIDELHSNCATDVETWASRNRNMEVEQMGFEDYDDWLEALKEYRMSIEKLSGVLQNGQFGDALKENLDFPDEHYDDAPAYLASVLAGMKDTYRRAPEHARYVVSTEYADLDGGRLDIDETDKASLDFAPYENDDGRMPLEERFTLIAKNL